MYHTDNKNSNFYPRPPRGGRPAEGRSCTAAAGFLSTPSARRATPGSSWLLQKRRFLSTPSARRATAVAGHSPLDKRISIHALREEGDARSTPPFRWPRYFYPRPPRGGRPGATKSTLPCSVFLSTPSARRATSRPTLACRCHRHFYPRPPRGGRLASRHFPLLHTKISIHALREEGDRRRKVLRGHGI